VFLLQLKKKVINNNHTHNPWITRGIKISRKKKELLILCRHCNDPNLKIYYKEYCTMLSKVTLTAKQFDYNKLILSSRNKMKCTILGK